MIMSSKTQAAICTTDILEQPQGSNKPWEVQHLLSNKTGEWPVVSNGTCFRMPASYVIEFYIPT